MAQTFTTPINTNDQSFDRVLAAGLPVLAVLYSGKIDPALDSQLAYRAEQDAGKLLAVRIKLDENPELARRFGIRGATLLTLRDGKESSRVENPSAADVRAHSDYLLGRGPKPTPPAESRGTNGSGEGRPVTITDQTFAREVMQANLPVIVDFWAPWCGPCRMIAPALEKIARDYAGRVRVAKMNVDENPQTPMQFQVQGIPTLLLVKNGRVVDRIVGALPEPQLRTVVERLAQS